MATITIDDIERDPAGFLRRVKAGEAMTIVQARKTVAMITPTNAEHVEPTGQRPIGLAKGQFTVPDDFDTPDARIIEEFGGL